MKVSEFIAQLQAQLEESGDLEIVKVNTTYVKDGYAWYELDNAPASIVSDGEDFGLELHKETFIIW